MTSLVAELSIREPRKVTVVCDRDENDVISWYTTDYEDFICRDEVVGTEPPGLIVLGVDFPNLVDGGTYYVAREARLSDEV